MELRKFCKGCGTPLIAFQGQFMHPESPCSGTIDYIMIEATIQDEFLQKKFTDLYGEPKIDDYEKAVELEKIINHPVVKLFLKIIRKYPFNK